MSTPSLSAAELAVLWPPDALTAFVSLLHRHLQALEVTVRLKGPEGLKASPGPSGCPARWHGPPEDGFLVEKALSFPPGTLVWAAPSESQVWGCAALRDPQGMLGVVYVLHENPAALHVEQLNAAREVLLNLTLGLRHQELQAEHHRLLQDHQRIMEQSPDLVVFSENGVVSFVNPASETLLGYLPEEMQGRPYLDFIVPEDHPLTVDQAQRHPARRQPTWFKNRYRHKDGHEVHLEWKYVQLSRGVLGVARDVTRHVQQEQAFQHLFEMNPLPMYVMEEDTLNFLEVNRSMVEHYGYSKDEFMTMTVMDIRPLEERLRVRLHIDQQTEPFSSGREVWTHLTRQGERRRVRVHQHKLTLRSRPARLVVIEDVTTLLETHQELQRAVIASEQLLQLVEHIEQQQHPLDVIRFALQNTLTLLHLDFGFHIQVQEDQMQVVSTAGFPPAVQEADLKDLGATLPFFHGSPHTVGLFDRETQHFVPHQTHHTLTPHHLLVVPVRVGEGITDVLVFGTCENTPLHPHATRVLLTVRERVVHLLEREGFIRQLQASREETLKALGVALEYRDYETKGHTDRVMDLTVKLGMHLGFVGTDLDALRWGAYLHDTGKIAIPDHILLKPGKLTTAEFELVKKHSVMGFEMLKHIPNLPQETLEVVLHHHERWDGKGYPHGLQGEAIPLVARVFSVVDVFDALISKRPYKDPFSFEDALTEIQRVSGSMFDPQVVEAFLQVVLHQTYESHDL